MKVVTFNVNGIRARLHSVSDLLHMEEPDVLCLQEIKCENDLFPYDLFSGYYCYVHGQKAYNGVAICSRAEGVPVHIMEEVESRTMGTAIGDILFVNVYAPHGDLRGTSKFFQKIQWYKSFSKRMEELLEKYPKALIVGDFNVAFEDKDVWDPILLKDTVGTLPEEREALNALLEVGFIDVFRALYPEKVQFTWWDYRQGRVWKNQGLRIDYVLCSEPLLASVSNVYVVEEIRKRRDLKPSDHAPVVCVMSYDTGY